MATEQCAPGNHSKGKTDLADSKYQHSQTSTTFLSSSLVITRLKGTAGHILPFFSVWEKNGRLSEIYFPMEALGPEYRPSITYQFSGEEFEHSRHFIIFVFIKHGGSMSLNFWIVLQIESAVCKKCRRNNFGGTKSGSKT